MRPSCKRCSGFITLRHENIEVPEDFIFCWLCGWRYYRPPQATPRFIGESARQRAERRFQELLKEQNHE